VSYRTNEIVDLGTNGQKNQQPVPRLVSLILQQAILDSADRIEFSLTGCSPKTQFCVSCSCNGKVHYFAPSPGELFEPVIVTLCNYASVPYYAKRPVKGRIETTSPDSSWFFESEDLKKSVVLSKAERGPR
jgi:hypothetical protein